MAVDPWRADVTAVVAAVEDDEGREDRVVAVVGAGVGAIGATVCRCSLASSCWLGATVGVAVGVAAGVARGVGVGAGVGPGVGAGAHALQLRPSFLLKF